MGIAIAAEKKETSTTHLLRLTIAAFLCYLTVGVPLPVLPLYVHHVLGFGNVLVGVTIGIQFLATVLTRRYAGRISDHRGAQLAMTRGFLMFSVAGATYILAAALPTPTSVKLTVLLAGRLLLGIGESLLITGGLAWGIGIIGQSRAGKVMAWTGMALYGALAIGSPLGLMLNHFGGFLGVSIGVTALPLLAWLIAAGVPAVPVRAVRHIAFSHVIRQVLRPGAALAMQGVGFAAIGTFITLYFDSHGWPNAGLALSGFGLSFILVRLLFGHLPDRIGGFPVAATSFLVEIAGQLLLWKASNGTMALAGAGVTGLGCSLMFPALGVEAVKRVPPENRGTALGAYAAFQDVSYGLTGPLAGFVATGMGYRDVFLLGTAAALIGLTLAFPRGRELRQP
jgi:MFS family permease